MSNINLPSFILKPLKGQYSATWFSCDYKTLCQKLEFSVCIYTCLHAYKFLCHKLGGGEVVTFGLVFFLPYFTRQLLTLYRYHTSCLNHLKIPS